MGWRTGEQQTLKSLSVLAAAHAGVMFIVLCRSLPDLPHTVTTLVERMKMRQTAMLQPQGPQQGPRGRQQQQQQKQLLIRTLLLTSGWTSGSQS